MSDVEHDLRDFVEGHEGISLIRTREVLGGENFRGWNGIRALAIFFDARSIFCECLEVSQERHILFAELPTEQETHQLHLEIFEIVSASAFPFGFARTQLNELVYERITAAVPLVGAVKVVGQIAIGNRFN